MDSNESRSHLISCFARGLRDLRGYESEYEKENCRGELEDEHDAGGVGAVH